MTTLANAYTFRMPFAIPGMLTRGSGRSNVKAELYGATAFPYYGLPCVLSSGTVIPVSSNLGATANSIYGWLVRPYPLMEFQYQDTLTIPQGGVPLTAGIANVMTSGYIGVYVQAGASSVAEGGAVYLRYQTTGGGITIYGGVEGTTSGNNFAIVNITNSRATCYFTGPCDANGYTEIAFGV